MSELSDRGNNQAKDARHKYKQGMLEKEGQPLTSRRRGKAEEARIKRKGEILNKRRKIHPYAAGQSVDPVQLQEALEGLRKGGSGLLEHVRKLREMLSLELPPIQDVIDGGGVEPLLRLLGNADDDLKLEATWCLTNMASGDTSQTRHVVEGAPAFITFLACGNPLLQEQAAWALGNIAGDSPECRALLTANGAILPLTRLLSSQSPDLARTAAWALSNLARGENTSADPFAAAGTLPLLVQLLQNEACDSKLRVELAWLAAFLTAREDHNVTSLVKEGLAQPLVRSLVLAIRGEEGGELLATPVLRSLGNLCAGLPTWLEAAMEVPQFLPVLAAALGADATKQRALVRWTCLGASELRLSIITLIPTSPDQVKEAAWTVSNVCAGSAAYRTALLQQGVLSRLAQLLKSDQFDLQREAVHAVWNLVAEGANLQEVIDMEGVLEAIVKLLKVPDTSVVVVVLSMLDRVCATVPGGPLCVEQAHGLEAIDDLHYSQVNEQLCAQAAKIVDTYYGEDYIGEGEHVGAMSGMAERSPPHTIGRGKAMTEPAWMHHQQH
ncbi:unnamed protein product [Chrysoparadoxa australica]